MPSDKSEHDEQQAKLDEAKEEMARWRREGWCEWCGPPKREFMSTGLCRQCCDDHYGDR
jgi:ribosomal protein S14